MNITLTPMLSRFMPNYKQAEVKKEPIANNKYPNLAPLANDTVNFGVGAKALEEGNRLSVQMGKSINKILEEPFVTFQWRLEKMFEKLVATEKHPNRPIYRIDARIKSPESIAEKGGARDCKNIRELTKRIQDLMGGRLVMRDCSKKSMQEVLDVLEDAVKKGICNITEIECYYPEENLAYVTREMVTSLVKTCKEKGPLRVEFTEHPAGYCAVHYTLRLPKDCDNAFAELQVMGVHEEAIKYAQDPAYKFEWGKGLPKKYKILEQYLAPLRSGDEELENAYKEYTRRVYIAQRLKEETPLVGKAPVPEFDKWYYPKEMDYNFLYAEMKKCDAAYAEKAAANQAKLEKAKLTKKRANKAVTVKSTAKKTATKASEKTVEKKPAEKNVDEKGGDMTNVKKPSFTKTSIVL